MQPLIQPDLLDKILIRLELKDRPAINYDGLSELYQSWCRRVPFDNLLKILCLKGNEDIEFPGNDEVLFFRSWLKYGTGGTCWAGNGALHTLLNNLGFNSKRRRGTMLIGQATSPDHGSVTVELDGVLYLVDASMLHAEPLELQPGKRCEIKHGAWGLSCHPEENDWLIWWRPLHLPEGCFCRIENKYISREEWLARNNLARSVSPFNDSLYARKTVGNDVVGIEHGARTVFHGDGSVVRETLTHRQILDCLADELGYATEFLARLPEE